MNRVVASVFVGLLMTTTLVPRAEAGGKEAIGLGVGILVGAVLRDAMASQAPPAPWPVYVAPGPPVYGPPPQWVRASDVDSQRSR